MSRRVITIDTTQTGVTATITVPGSRPIVVDGPADEVAIVVAAQIHALCDAAPAEALQAAS